jgi:hypothetical protein
MPLLHKPLIAAVCIFAPLALAQTPSPQLSPKAAYDQAMHPLDLTRQSISNWSDTETAALTVTIANAAASCAPRDAKNYIGTDLVDIARLCALGQLFSQVISAATRYIDSPEAATGAKQQLAFAYAALINAQLHLKDEPAALASVKNMLTAVPYDATVADAIDSAINYMQFLHTADALALATARQPLLLAQIQQLASSTTQASSSQPSLHDLYADGLALPALQQLAKSPSTDVTATIAALDAALPTTLTPDDAIPIAAARRRYALLGKPLPDIAHPQHPADPKHPAKLTMLAYPGTLPELPARNTITALLLFPDWCAQCLRMVNKFPETVFTVSGHEAYLYGLLAPTMPQASALPKPAAPGGTVPFDPHNATSLLQNTPVLVVDPSFLDQFAATDVPLFILTDTQGIIRVIQPVDEAAIAPGSTIDSSIACIGVRFPRPVKPTSPPQAH